VKLFVDQDTGPGIAKALRAVNERDIDYPGKDRLIQWGDPDSKWLEYAGGENRMVLSRNHRLLDSPAEVQLLINHRVGIVFLPQHMEARDLLHLVLSRWHWLEQIEANEPRPFAFRVYSRGRTRQIDL
jgi:hypothetical protein